MVAPFPQQLVKVAVAVDKQRHHAREDPKMAHLGPKLDDRPLYGLAKVQGSIGALTICLPSACLLLAFCFCRCPSESDLRAYGRCDRCRLQICFRLARCPNECLGFAVEISRIRIFEVDESNRLLSVDRWCEQAGMMRWATG